MPRNASKFQSPRLNGGYTPRFWQTKFNNSPICYVFRLWALWRVLHKKRSNICNDMKPRRERAIVFLKCYNPFKFNFSHPIHDIWQRLIFLFNIILSSHIWSNLNNCLHKTNYITYSFEGTYVLKKTLKDIIITVWNYDINLLYLSLNFIIIELL